MSPQPKLIFRVGDTVRIKTGPFASFTSRVEGINQAKFLLKVAINLFGRVTPIKLEAEKLEYLPRIPPWSTQN